jgi:hypothetical protein
MEHLNVVFPFDVPDLNRILELQKIQQEDEYFNSSYGSGTDYMLNEVFTACASSFSFL